MVGGCTTITITTACVAVYGCLRKGPGWYHGRRGFFVDNGGLGITVTTIITVVVIIVGSIDMDAVSSVCCCCCGSDAPRRCRCRLALLVLLWLCRWGPVFVLPAVFVFVFVFLVLVDVYLCRPKSICDIVEGILFSNHSFLSAFEFEKNAFDHCAV